MNKFLNWNDPPWADLKALALECGFTDDGYGNPVCGDWDAVRRFAYRVATITNEYDRKCDGRLLAEQALRKARAEASIAESKAYVWKRAMVP